MYRLYHVILKFRWSYAIQYAHFALPAVSAPSGVKPPNYKNAMLYCYIDPQTANVQMYTL